MQTQIIGDFTIDRVLESEGPFRPLDYVLPGATPDIIEENADWLKPNFIDPASNDTILSFHGMLVRTPRHTILVDCCAGNDKERPDRPFWHRKQFPFLDNMLALGVRPEEIDIVLCTHLHADHVGWNTRLEDGRWVPTFANARYVFGAREYDHWRAEAEAGRSKGEAPLHHGSFDDSVLPIVEAGRAVMVESDHALDDGIWLEPAPGHTPGNVVLRVENGGRKALLAGDVMHTPAQLARPQLSSLFCTDPVQSSETRMRLVDGIAETDTVLLTGHFPTPTAGRVVRRGDGFRLAWN